MNYILRLKGGKGSGNFDHQGIVGHQGGSLPKYEAPKKLPPALQALINFRDEDLADGKAERSYNNALRKVAFDISEKVRRRDAVGVRRDYRKMVMEYEKLQSHKFREQEVNALIDALKQVYFVKSRS